MHQLNIWPPGGVTWISCKLAPKWHHKHRFKLWWSGGVPFISSKVGHQVVPVTQVTILATRLRHLDCHILPWIAQLKSCTNLESPMSKKEKVPSMAKNLTVTTSISDLKNYLSDIHGSCRSFRTKWDFSFFSALPCFIHLFGLLWPNLTQPSMNCNDLNCVNSRQ